MLDLARASSTDRQFSTHFFVFCARSGFGQMEHDPRLTEARRQGQQGLNTPAVYFTIAQESCVIGHFAAVLASTFRPTFLLRICSTRIRTESNQNFK